MGMLWVSFNTYKEEEEWEHIGLNNHDLLYQMSIIVQKKNKSQEGCALFHCNIGRESHPFHYKDFFN